jgi:hypothetical protein
LMQVGCGICVARRLRPVKPYNHILAKDYFLFFYIY